MFCPECGASLPEELQFCIYCGANVTEVKEIECPKKPGKKPKKKWWIPVLLIVLVAAIAGGVAAYFFMPRTYRLLTKSKNVQSNGYLTTTTEYSYDSEGRLTEFKRTQKHKDMDYTNKTSITYEYSKDGVLEYAVLKQDGKKIADIEYTFSKGVLKDVEVDADEDYDVKVDSKGRIVRIQTENYDASYKYHANGKVKEKDVSYGDAYRTVNRMNEDGMPTEVITYMDGEEYSRTVYEYDENGNFSCIKGYAEGEKITDATITYTYEKKEIVGAVLKVETPAGDGEIEFSVKKKGDKYKATVKDIDMDSDTDVDEEDLEQMEDIVVEFSLDDEGKILDLSITAGDMTIIEMESEYEEMKLPRDYEQPDMGNPMWFINQ